MYVFINKQRRPALFKMQGVFILEPPAEIESTSLVSKTGVLSIVRKRHKDGGSNRNRTYFVQNMNLVHYLNTILPEENNGIEPSPLLTVEHLSKMLSAQHIYFP